MGDITYKLIKKGLDAAALRQKVIAHNIANINTRGFKRSDVVFEDALKEAIDKGKTNIDSLEPKVVQDNSTSMRLDGNNVDIDIEMANMSANNILYNALIEQANVKYDILRSAINGGGK